MNRRGSDRKGSLEEEKIHMNSEETWSFIRTIDAWYVLGPIFVMYVGWLIWMTKKQELRFNVYQYITCITLGIYVLSVMALTTFPIEINLGMYKNQSPWYSRINPIPILTIDLATFLLNIIMLIPFGVYLWLMVKPEKISWELVATKSLVFSLLIEVLQMLLYITLNSGRSVDVNDLIANTLGGVIGFYFMMGMSKNTYFQGLIHLFGVKTF